MLSKEYSLEENTIEDTKEAVEEEVSNVIPFPNVAVRPLPIKSPTKEIVDAYTENIKHYHVARTLAEIGPQLLTNMEVAGLHINSDPDMSSKDGAFLMETLRAFMYRYYKLHHPFHVMFDNVFIEDQESGALKLADKLDVEIKKAINE